MFEESGSYYFRLRCDDRTMTLGSSFLDSVRQLKREMSHLYIRDYNANIKYTAVELLGKGGNGVVKKVTKTNRPESEEFALKTIQKSKDFETEMLTKEIVIQNACFSCPNVIKLFKIFETKTTI